MHYDSMHSGVNNFSYKSSSGVLSSGFCTKKVHSMDEKFMPLSPLLEVVPGVLLVHNTSCTPGSWVCAVVSLNSGTQNMHQCM